jgi:hypothetical protein
MHCGSVHDKLRPARPQARLDGFQVRQFNIAMLQWIDFVAVFREGDYHILA